LTMIRFSSLCAVGRDSLPVGCRNLRVPALLKTKEWVPMGEIAASHPSYKFGDSRGFKIDGILCFNCFASAWPLELRQFGSFKCHVGAGLPSGCLAVDRAVDRAIATKIRISLHSRSCYQQQETRCYLVVLRSWRIPWQEAGRGTYPQRYMRLTLTRICLNGLR
jgi:hypothetical protein